MNGIEKITARISQDSQEEISRLNAETDAKVAEIAAQAQAQAQKETEETLARGKRAAAERLERLKSAAQMETRKLTLAAKQEVLDETFNLALKKLLTMPEKEYITLLTRLALEASSTGKEKLIFSQKDRNRIGKQVVLAANESLRRQGSPASLTLAEETRKIRGGFIMVDGDVEVNCAFETLVRLQREKLELSVAKTLFEN